MQTYSAASQINIPSPPTFLTYRRNISPSEGLRGTGMSAETLSAKRGSRNFAVTGGMFSITYEP